ncbi:MAG: serine/threonine-protein kinase [Acidobacteriota bacterium]
MTSRKLICDRAATTPTTLDSAGKPRPLPDDLLREASQRLGIMGLLGATLWITGTVLGHFAAVAMGASPELDGSHAISAASAAISLGLFFYTRVSERNPRFILDLGLAYMVLTAVALGMTFHWQPMPAHMPIFPMITWIGAVVVMFAAIVPSPPMKTLVASLIAASMNPLGMLIAKARGLWDFGPISNVLVMHYPDFLLVGVAVVIAHVHTKLGRHVAKAREMGSYHLGELLGRGGMGEVYKATHRMLARPAAIKLIRPEMLGAQNGESAQITLQRFRREAEAAANLRSPHTVELYDFGVTGDQTMYFVMEMLDGMNLDTLIRKHGALPAGRAIFILRQACQSLEEAHARGLVHRDIKPANIHVGRLGLQHDFVKVLDFGLVKSVAAADTEQSLATAAGLTPGTPAYMSPEMVLGEAVDARADIYALGCVAYYLLTGALVFESSSVAQAVAMTLRDEPIPPSRRTKNPIPPALEAAVLACLAKKRDGRPRSAAELSVRLAAIATSPWGEDEARRWWDDVGADFAIDDNVLSHTDSFIATALKQ